MPPKKKGAKGGGGGGGKDGGKKMAAKGKAKPDDSAILLARAEQERAIGEEMRQANFGEDRWRPLVSLIVGGRKEDDHHIKALDETVKVGQRKLYKSLSKNDIVEAVKEFGNPKLVRRWQKRGKERGKEKGK